ncbi:metal dependent phosphohydrolase [Leptothrix cholodnii SP-6]|uniref:Metal dependent phosphohydrolase n=1 Tax=Leptothrix cholodnii (strain ATCC 51168 / LMG 8142 / SP-6) TaxID=395495 RepID=B1Y7Q7_LEPCP|nr:HD domain-containing phosphohydrolase [Leptothrix cholodnii]ACB32505.1 metal dependent phosphohydrolase [Leptothrix cholodnii SP-6]
MTIPEALHLLEVGAHSHDSVTSRLAVLHAQIRRLVPAVDRISCALHEPEDGLLKTFVHSTTSAQPLQAYQFRLADSASLSALVRERGERVIDDMQTELHGHGHAHTEWLLAQGYRSSYTLPLFDHENLIGLLFFDALTPSAFQPLVCERLRPYASLIAMLLSQELSTMRMLVGSIQIAREFANLRDIETGSHLSRMAAFAQLIALRLAHARGYDDEFIEHVYLFAPLHDIGKIGVPDHIMLKPGALDADEWRQMTEHVDKGEQIVERLIETFSLAHLAGVQVLRQIVAGHHERIDGSGYPRGLRGAELPDAARIITVADIYDALRSERPYKPAWRHDEVAAELRRMAAAGRLDAEMVEALLAEPAALEAIRTRFHDADGVAAC